MIRSMTAFGRAVVSSSLGTFIVEIQTLNRKYLDINILLPSELSFLENDVRQWVSESIKRGKVTVKVEAIYLEKTPLTVSPNLPLAIQLKSAWEQIAAHLNLSLSDEIMMRTLTQEPHMIQHQENIADEINYRDMIKKTVTEALEEVSLMKDREGQALFNDIATRLNALEQWFHEIERYTEGSVSRYQEKLKNTIEEVLPQAIDNEERILREICLWADKIDISEEITRFRSHLEQFRDKMQSENKRIGKNLEFLLQEMIREINTIGSKTSEIEVSNRVVNAKTEIEKVREQVQNVE